MSRAAIRTPLLERATLPAGRVDRERRVISGVKVLGRESQNGRTYTRECLERAVPLYEKKPVYFWHGKKVGPRTGTQPAGWLENVRARPDGLYADLHYLESHPLCASLVEAAERNPSLWCLSHNAHGDARRTATGEEITDILEVHSVDLVERGATTRGLFEGQPMKLSEYLAALKVPAAASRRVKQLLEAATMDPTLPMPDDMAAPPAADAPEGDHMEALKGGFMAAISALAQQCLDGTTDEKTCIKKIVELLKTHGKLAAGVEPVESDEPDGDEMADGLEEEDESGEGADGAEEENGGKKPYKESVSVAALRAELKELKARESCRALLEEASVKATPALLKSLCRLDSDDERRALLEEVGRSDTKPAAKKPQTQRPAGTGASKPAGLPRTTEDFVKALRNGSGAAN